MLTGLFRRLRPQDDPEQTATPPAPLFPPKRQDLAQSLPPGPHVFERDGAFYLHLPDQRVFPLMRDGKPVRNLLAGWRFGTVSLDYMPLLVVTLAHDAHGDASWFFDEALNYVADTVAQLPPLFRSLLLRPTVLALRDLMSPFVNGETRQVSQREMGFFKLSESTRRDAGRACREELLLTADVVLAEDWPGPTLLDGAFSPSSASMISRQNLVAALECDFQERVTQASVNGVLNWISPISGLPNKCSGSLCFDNFSFAYRFDDSSAGLVYFVLTSLHNCTCVGIYIPSLNTIIVRNADARVRLALIFPDVAAKFLDYTCRFGEELSLYLLSGPKAIAVSLREGHLGHQIWNELTGLEAMLAQSHGGKLPAILVVGGAANEHLGPLDHVFPELAGRVNRELMTSDDVIAYAHRHNVVVARLTREYVPASLRNRIWTHVEKTDFAKALLVTRKDLSLPVIVVGLRVENRTLVDLGSFLRSLVGIVAVIAPGASIVIDGQNGRDVEGSTRPLGSFADHLATRSPLEVELELCAELTRYAAGKPVTIVTASGRPVVESVAWIAAASCIIALWGAGLAKYRWIGNKPCFILTSHWNVVHRSDLHIYDLPQYMEDPTPVEFVEASDVFDDPGAQRVIPLEGSNAGSYSNFACTSDAVFDKIRVFVLKHITAHGPA